MLLSGLNTF